MEKTLEKAEDKIQKICDALKRETLEPAQQEAQDIIREAKERADRIIKEAREEANQLHQKAREEIEQERNVFHSSLEQAGKQTLEELRQAIEHHLFSDELQAVLDKVTADPKVIAKLVTAIINAIEKEGTSTRLSIVVPETVSPEEVGRLLAEGITAKLKEKPIALGEFGGGAQVKLIDRKMTLDITDVTLKEILSSYVRKDFRKLLFKT